ncbi:hypothetical protein MHU86_14464 [Fragilaria crotonensis]|nr:hypothetical protein MHU86_14464 [Fragilaria crotonensis]
MGAGFFLPSTRRHDRIEIFDYTSLIIDGRLLKSVQAPACLEELVDWTKAANLMIRDMPDMIQIRFRPYIKTSYHNDEPDSDLSSVVIVGEGAEAGTLPDSTLKKSVISVPDFASTTCCFEDTLKSWILAGHRSC